MSDKPCVHCGEPVPALPDPDLPILILVKGERQLHPECLIRMLVGSISHQLKKCHCYGGAWDDPPELTKREAARMALDYYAEQNGIPGLEDVDAGAGCSGAECAAASGTGRGIEGNTEGLCV